MKKADSNKPLPKFEIVQLSLLKPNPNNARTHSPKQIQKLMESVTVFGFINPVIIDKNNMIIAGYGRVEAARILGIKEIPIIRIEHLDKDQLRAYVIADNRLAELAGWNNSILAIELQHLTSIELDFDIDVTGFNTAEIDLLIEQKNQASESKKNSDDELPDITGRTLVSRVGDLWLLDNHRVYCGDALEESSFTHLMQNKKAAMVFIDPPYNVPINGHVCGLGDTKHPEFAMGVGEMTKDKYTTFFLIPIFSLVIQFSKAGSIHYICIDWRHLAEVIEAGKVYTELKNLCVWVKDNGGMGTFYRSQHELIFVFKNGKARHKNNFLLGQHGRYRTNVWQYAGCNSFSRHTDEGNLLALHPTVKPVTMVADAIMDCSNRGDIILDSVLGSGTTLIAAERTGRVCYGIELEPLYVDTTIRRWQKLTGKQAVHAKNNMSFNEIEALSHKEAKNAQ